MLFRTIVVDLLMAAIALTGNAALSAEIEIEKKYLLSLSGKIIAGDAERLAAYFMTQKFINKISLLSGESRG